MATKIVKDNIVPAGLADRWEIITATAAQRLFIKRKQVLEAIGARPYKGLPVSPEEIRSRVLQLRNDPEALFGLLADNAKFTPDGQVLLPKELIDHFVKAESELRQGGAA